MITLQEINLTNFNECISLKRESCRFVGNAESVLAEAYIYRDDSLAYAIYFNETMVGLVIIRVFPTEAHPYSFTDCGQGAAASPKLPVPNKTDGSGKSQAWDKGWAKWR